jgi:hypothetical protein
VAASFFVFRPQLETIANRFPRFCLQPRDRPSVPTLARQELHLLQFTTTIVTPTSCRFAAYAEFLNMPNDSGPMTSPPTFSW